MDPNTLHLDQDPELWPNFDPDQGYVKKNTFLILQNFKKIMSSEEIFSQSEW